MRLGTSLAFTSIRTRKKQSTPLRVAEVQARGMTNFNTMLYSNDAFFVRMPFVIGQDMKDILLSFINWYQWTVLETDTGNAFTVSSCSIESLSGTVVPVYFGGSRSKVIADGANDIQSDTILPSAFGLNKFSRGEQYWIKLILNVPNGCKIPRTSRMVAAVSGSQTAWYQSSVTFPSSTDIAGQFTTTGTAPVAQPNGYQPLVLGHPVVDEPSFIAVGDSIGDGAGDTTAATLYGHGFIQRAMGNNGTNPLPCLNFCRPSTTSDHAVAGTKWRAYVKYARYAIEEFGTNDIVISTKTVAATQASLSSLWSILKSEGAQGIIKSNLLCFTTSTDNWLTSANQTIRTGWTAGDKTDQLNAWFATKVTDGTLMASVAYPNIKDTGNANKWLVDNVTANYITVDGVHPSPLGHDLVSQPLRAVIAALS